MLFFGSLFRLTVLLNAFLRKHLYFQTPRSSEGEGKWKVVREEKKIVWTESRLKNFHQVNLWLSTECEELLLLLNSREVFIFTIWQLIMVNKAIFSFVFLALGLALSFFARLCLSSHRAQHATNSCQGMVLLQVTLPRSGPERTLNCPRWGCKDPQGQEGTGVQKEWASAWQPHHQPGLLLLAAVVPWHWEN